MRAEESPQRKKRRAAGRRREEKRWAAKSGPVTVRFVDPETLRESTKSPVVSAELDGDVERIDQAEDEQT
jgi:hypothetical protein